MIAPRAKPGSGHSNQLDEDEAVAEFGRIKNLAGGARVSDCRAGGAAARPTVAARAAANPRRYQVRPEPQAITSDHFD